MTAASDKVFIRRVLISVIGISAVVGAVSYYFHLDDFLKAAAFRPSSELSAVESKISLTPAGRRVFYASAPALEPREVFNENCTTLSEDSYILGCYTTVNDRVHIYDVELDDSTSELAGVVESTTAHELLHAVWQRLPVWERTAVSGRLKKVYDSADDDFKNEFKLYKDDEFYDELHSRAAVELEDLPEELEAHYAKYLSDRKQLVKYFLSYSSAFRELERQADALADRIRSESASLDKDTEDYYERSDRLNQRIGEFNTCAADPSACGRSVASLESERTEIAAEIDSVNGSYDELNSRVEAYNKMVDEYDSLVVRSKKYSDVLDSKSVTEKSIKTKV